MSDVTSWIYPGEWCFQSKCNSCTNVWKCTWYTSAIL